TIKLNLQLLSACGSSDTLVVTQTPNVSVMEGGTVNISCCWTGSGESQRLRVIWLKNLMEIKNEAVNLTSPPVKKERNDCWNLTFSSVTKEATGRYICRVTAEIPVLASASGSGTVLTVTSRGNTVTSGYGYRLSIMCLFNSCGLSQVFCLVMICVSEQLLCCCQKLPRRTY
uniref:Ig-like domain-containing protein n=1 Tax=Mastacembelus armatus TaxID=205130 RepID=A0A7N8WQC3_9TELE